MKTDVQISFKRDLEDTPIKLQNVCKAFRQSGIIPCFNPLLQIDESQNTYSLLSSLLHRTRRKYSEIAPGYRMMRGDQRYHHIEKMLLIESISLEELLYLGRKYKREVVIHCDGLKVTSYIPLTSKPELEMSLEEAALGWLTAMSMPGSICFPAAG